MHFENEPMPPQNDQTVLAADVNGTFTMGSLFADMNHDIRTSMNGIVGMLELLLDTGLNDSQHKYAKIAQDNVDTLLEMIERIVDLSLIETKQFKLAQTPFDLRQELQSACSNKHAMAEAKGLQLTVNYPAAIMLAGDPARVRQITASMMNSAIRIAESGDLKVDVDTKLEQDGRCHLGVTIHATAVSAAGLQLAQVLNQPVKSCITALRAYGKSTVEVALCAQLARLMGGRMGVDLSPPQGMTFWFSLVLPLAPGIPAGMHVMLLAEHPADWLPLATLLAACGMRVDTFDSATSALAAAGKAAAEQSAYRMILLVPKVQGMDAEVLAAAIKADAAYRDAVLGLLDANSSDQKLQGQTPFAFALNPSMAPQTLLSMLSALPLAFGGNRAPAPVSPPSSPAGTAPALAGRRILIADDNDVNQQVAARMLEKLGCKAAVAGNGQEAVDMHVASCYDLILMDCDMPQLDGYQATRRIREIEGIACRTPVIALTACTTQDEREKCMAAGMNDFLSKPIRPQVLKDVLARWLPSSATTESRVEQTGHADELESVQAMFGDDFPELASLYLRDSPPRLETLRRALAGSDHVLLAKVAHVFSGSSASIGATGLSALCKELELNTKAGILGSIAKQLAAIEAEYSRISSRLKTMVAT